MTDDVAVDVLVKEFPGRTIQVQTELWFYPDNKKQPQRVRRFWLSVLPGLDGDKCDGWRGASIAECVQKAMAARDAVRLTPKCETCGQTIKELSAAQAGTMDTRLTLKLPIEALQEGQPCPVCNEPLKDELPGVPTVEQILRYADRVQKGEIPPLSNEPLERSDEEEEREAVAKRNQRKADRDPLDPAALARAELEPLL